MTKTNITTDYIKLGQLLKFKGVIASGADIKAFLMENVVKVNNINENRRGRKLYPNDIIDVCGQTFVITHDL